MKEALIEKNWVVGPFQCNCRLLVCAKTGEAALIDSGDEAPRILQELAKVTTSQGAPIQVKYLIHTHGHLDHIGATRGVREGLEVAGIKPKIAIHRADEPLYQQLKMQGQLFRLQYEDPLPVDHFLEDEEELRIGELKISVLHIPGHSPGSVGLRLHEGSGAKESVFSGDTLFQGSVGRTDLWGADHDLMFKSIRERLLTLDDDTRVCPGHGADSKIGIERRQNPFLI
jgi:glyoxylase-like metal-dependent hydrolase (beta-lactamase superfamily II)